MKIVYENGLPWTERSYDSIPLEVESSFDDANGIKLDGWYYPSGRDFGNQRFLSVMLKEEPVLKSKNEALTGAEEEFTETLTSYFQTHEYNKGEKFYIVMSHVLTKDIMVCCRCHFEDLYTYLKFIKRDPYFSIIVVDEGVHYEFRTLEHYYALYVRNTRPPGIDLHEHFIKFYDFTSKTVLVHVHSEPDIGPIIVEDPVFIPHFRLESEEEN